MLHCRCRQTGSLSSVLSYFADTSRYVCDSQNASGSDANAVSLHSCFRPSRHRFGFVLDSCICRLRGGLIETYKVKRLHVLSHAGPVLPQRFDSCRPHWGNAEEEEHTLHTSESGARDKVMAR